MRLIASSAVAVMVVVGSHALAQQSPPTVSAGPPPNAPSGGTPDAIPFDIPYGTPVAADRAKELLGAAEAEAKKRNWKMNITVVDSNGDLIHFLRMDGAMLASISISQGKARTAARWRRPTQGLYNAYEAGHAFLSTLADDVPVSNPGGFPLVEGGKIIGAIGCSGGTGDQDAVICKVAAEMVK
jgi:glc operon protein GlcG